MSMPPVNNSNNNNNNNSECCSENESESSSGYRKLGAITRRYEIEGERTRALRQSAVTIKRAVSLPRTTAQPTIASLKHLNRINMSNTRVEQSSMTMSRVQARTPKPQKPNSLPHIQSRSCKPTTTASTPTPHKRPENTVRIRSSMLSVELKSTTTAQNPYGTVPRRRKQKSVEDLLNGGSLDTRSSSVNCDARMVTSMGMGKAVSSVNARKQLQLNYTGMSSNSSSAWTTPTQSHATRWPNVSSAPSRKQQTVNKSQRTRIYYEQSVQTSLTNNDMVKLFNGKYTDPGPLIRTTGSFDCQNQAIQCTDIRDVELEKLRDEVRSLSISLQREREEKLLLQSELQLNTERVMSMLEVARINGIGGSGGVSVDGWTPTSEDDASTGTGSCSVSGHDSLLMLESQIQLSGQELVERQHEVRQLRQLCRSLQTEMQRSIAAQQFLLQEKAAIEQESNELQDFLQHEKITMHDALRELETDLDECKSQLSQREDDVKTLREKCQYLVRLNEQRRQENLLLQTKFNDFKSKSRNYVAQKHNSLGIAYSVLSKLHGRLRSLVDELKLTYNLSEQDLECQSGLEQTETTKSIEKSNTESENGNNNENSDRHSLEIIHNNKPTTVVGNGDDNDAAADLSPQRHQTFIAAIISAIRSATITTATTTTTTSNKRALPINQQPNIVAECDNNAASVSLIPFACNGNSQLDCANDMLDLETEPCLMMENVLEDVKLPDTYSQNMVTKQTAAAFPPDIELFNVLNTEIVTTESLSLHNLSQAIVNRQQIEMQETEDIVNSFFGDLLDAGSLIEKVNDVDVLVTRLLRLIQMDNDNCIQQLIVDKNKLQQNREEMLEKIRELEEVNMKLQDDLMDATQELMLKSNEITGKNELQAHANEIDVRF